MILRMCADSCWATVIATYMGPRYSILAPLANQVAYIMATADAGSVLAQRLRNCMNAFHKTCRYLEKVVSEVEQLEDDEIQIVLHVCEVYNERQRFIKSIDDADIAKLPRTTNIDLNKLVRVIEDVYQAEDKGQAIYQRIMNDNVMRLYWRYDAAHVSIALMPICELLV